MTTSSGTGIEETLPLIRWPLHISRNAHYKAVQTEHPDFVQNNADTSIKVTDLRMLCTIGLCTNAELATDL